MTSKKVDYIIHGAWEKYKHLIPQGEFEGYYWLSDAIKPEVQHKGAFPFSVLEQRLPMAMEAQYFHNASQLSILVKNIDGNLIATLVDLKAVPVEQQIHRFYQTVYSDKLGYRITEIWEESEGDETTAFLPVNKAICNIFTGFYTKKED